MRGRGRVARASGKDRTPLGAAGDLSREGLDRGTRTRMWFMVGIGVVGAVGTVVVVVVGVGVVIGVVQRGPSG